MSFKSIMGEMLEKAKQSEYNRIFNPILVSNPDVIPGSEQLTYGPGGNNLSWSWSDGVGAWDFFVLDKINADILLIYQSRMAQMYLKVSTVNMTNYIPRNFKDELLRDKYPVFTVSKNWSV